MDSPNPGPIINRPGLDPSSVDTFQRVRFSLVKMTCIPSLILEELTGIIFWRDFAIFSHFFARNRIKIPGEKKNRTLNFSHFAPLSSYFAHAVHFETIGLFCLTSF